MNILANIKLYAPRVLALTIISLLLFQASPLVRVLAISPEDAAAIYGEYPFYEDSVDCAAVTKSATEAAKLLKSGSKVYILGDSITVRAADSYKQHFATLGVTPTISAVSGRSWTTAGNASGGATGTQGTGKDATDTDTGAIKAANGIIVALGTNGFGAANPIDEVINKFHALNSTAPIWWVNIATKPIKNTGVPDFNNKLDAAEAAGKLTVIPWTEVVDPGGDGTNNPNNVLDDGTHPSIPGGVELLVNQVTKSVATAGTESTPANNTSCACGGGATNLSGSNNEEKAFNFFKSPPLSFSPEQAAGIVGNLKVESGVEPLIEQGKSVQTSRSLAEYLASGESRRVPGTSGYGLVQWTGYSQLDAMVAWAKAAGKDPSTLDGQLAYVGYEIGSGGPKQSIGDAIKASATLDAAAAVWNVQYERSKDSQNPGSAGWKRRISFAKDILAKYGSGTSSTSSSSSTSCNTSGQTSGDYSLPVDRKWYDQHKDWFTKKHHDYPAADIPVPMGTPVYSISGGKIASAPNGGSCGIGVSIDAGNGVRFVYCHGSDGGSVDGAKQGDTVKPGQLIMHSASTGHSTGPHLHVGVKVDNTARCPQPLFVGIAEGKIPDLTSLPTSGCSN